jgi:hypothetical protein
MEQRFEAVVYKLGINPCVDIPEEVSEAFGIRGYVPVKGSLNGHAVRANLVPKGGGRHRLYLNGEMRARANVGVGDRVELVLEHDPLPRPDIPVPEALARAFEENPAAKNAFHSLTPSRQKEILSYLNYLKRPDSIQRNVDKVIQMLMDKG